MNLHKNLLSKYTQIIILVCSFTILQAQDLIISPSPLYMGKIPLGSDSQREVTIFNTTVSDVTVNSLSISGSDASNFTIVNNPGTFTLGAIEKRVITIQYNPSSAAMNSSQFDIASSAGSFNISINGYGIPLSGGIQAFERVMGTSEPDNGREVKQTADGGFIITGGTIPPDENYNSSYLLKTDVNGKVEWSSVYGDDDGPDNGNDVEQTSDGGYLVFGTTDNWGAGGTDMMLLKFDGSGNFVWRKTYGSINNDAGSAILATLDGGYALVGQTVPASGVGKTIYLVKVDADGNQQWENTYGGSSGTDASDIIQLSDGSFLMAGYFTVGSDFQVYVVKTNSSGNLIWEKNYGGGDLDYGFGIQELSDGNIIICGYTASKGAGARDGYLVKLNANGDLIWDKAYGFERSDEFKGVVETDDGNLIAVGNSIQRVTDQEQFSDAYMVKTDADGNEIWGRLFGENLSESFSEIHQTNDGGYITIGSASSYSKSSDIFLVKTSADGIVSGVDQEPREAVTNSIYLYQNYPNPFNPTTTIKIDLSSKSVGNVTLKVYDILGNVVTTLLNEKLDPGIYSVNFNAGNLSSGIYFYEVSTKNGQKTKKMMLIK